MDILYNMRREMLRRGMSSKSVKTYLFYVKKFLLFTKNKQPKEFSKADIRAFLYHLQERNLAGSSLNVVHNALRFMMIDILHKGMYLKIKFSKTPKREPQYLTQEEVKKLLGAIENVKHRTLVALMYGAGLRVSEVTNLKKQDLNFANMIGWVRGGKGNKDRPFIIPQTIKKDLESFFLSAQPYLFSGRKGRLTTKSVQLIVTKAGKQAKISKHVHPHMFRHSFTTHLIEQGHDISTVQSLLGHVHLETTFGYAHYQRPKLIRTQSPLDKLE